MEADLIGMLLADPTVAGIVGARVYPFSIPQGAPMPAITVFRITGGPEYADDGEIGLENPRVQIDCWGDTYTAAKALSVAACALLSGLRDVTFGATTFRYIMIVDVRDLREGGANSEAYRYRTSIDFTIWNEV